MKILIVDDDQGKVQLIAEALRLGGHSAEIVQETSATAARLRMRAYQYDLLLIDLNLPDTAVAPPSQNGGLDLFDLLVLDPLVRLPTEILFVTAEENLVERGRASVLTRGLGLCVFSNASVEWRSVLLGKAKLAELRSRSRVLAADVAIVTALRSPELDSVLHLNYGWKEYRLRNDPTLYYRGEIPTTGKSVVAASALRKGMASSAALAAKLAIKFAPRMLLMTGICAGVEGKVALGDVIVADPSWDWGSGKHAEKDDGSPVFRLSPVQRPLNTAVAGICAEIGRSQEFKRGVRAEWNGSFPQGQFGCHVGPMASGASVIADRSTARLIADQNRDLIGIEMEAFAVMAACEYTSSPPPIGVAIKSVCDYADPDKRDDWQAYAAYTSAAFAGELLARCCGQDLL